MLKVFLIWFAPPRGRGFTHDLNKVVPDVGLTLDQGKFTVNDVASLGGGGHTYAAEICTC